MQVSNSVALNARLFPQALYILWMTTNWHINVNLPIVEKQNTSNNRIHNVLLLYNNTDSKDM